MPKIRRRQILQVRALASEGLTCDEIVDRTGLTRDQVRHQLKRMGLLTSKPRLTDEDALLAFQMLQEKFDWRLVTATIGHCEESLKRRMAQLGLTVPRASDIITKTCEMCGGQYQGTRVSRYCSDECRRLARNASGRRYYERKRESKEPPRIVVAVCAFCGKSFEKPAWQSRKKYCSPECCEKAYRTSEKGRQARRQQRQRQRLRRPRVTLRAPRETRKCTVCGAEFECTVSSNRKYCSKKCAKKVGRKKWKRTPQGREAKRREEQARRAAKRGAYVAPVYFKQIAERDKWTCQLCGKPVKRKAKAPDPLAPTLDHIIPLAKGGTHEPKNVQLAHFLCNALKSDREVGQLRFIG